MTPREAANAMRGQRIRRVHLHPFDDGRGGEAYDLEFEFADGTLCRFHVQETETGVYGVAPAYPAEPKR